MPLLSLIVSNAVSTKRDLADSATEDYIRCVFCGKKIADGETIGQLDGEPYHTDCQHSENDRFAWRATLDAIYLGLGAEIRAVFPGGHDKLHELRTGLKSEGVKYSTAFTVISTVCTTLRREMKRFNTVRSERIDANLTGIQKILSDYLKGRA